MNIYAKTTSRKGSRKEKEEEEIGHKNRRVSASVTPKQHERSSVLMAKSSEKRAAAKSLASGRLAAFYSRQDPYVHNFWGFLQGQLWISQMKLILCCSYLVLLTESIMGNC